MKKIALLLILLIGFLACNKWDYEPIPSIDCGEKGSCNLKTGKCVCDSLWTGEFCDQFIGSGCTEPCAPNYSPFATIDDGSCLYYDAQCNTNCTFGDLTAWDAGSCSCIQIQSIMGCTDVTASNYNASANCDDGSCQNGLEFVFVEGGTFEMGCTYYAPDLFGCDFDEFPVHNVTLSDFKLSKYEITNFQYANFLNSIGAGSNGYFNGTKYIGIDDSWCKIYNNGSSFEVESGREEHPVVVVSWFGAKAYCEWVSGRLPTEGEWEFAARGGNQSQNYIYSGGNTANNVAWNYDNSGNGTNEIGLKIANELGLYDMSGNALEWCNDWNDSNYYRNSPVNNPQGAESGTLRVLRGGAWNSRDGLRVTNRFAYLPTDAFFFFGFRCAKDF